jgi:RHS repeat-associated protein
MQMAMKRLLKLSNNKNFTLIQKQKRKQFYTKLIMKKILLLLLLFLQTIIYCQTTPTGSSTEVGVTAGQLEVSLSGAATYSIPIAVPPGINDVAPRTSLVYNSQTGNGVAGYGWNIAGLSAITRVASTKFLDGIIDPVDFDDLDRFALDGQRLILKSGTGTYGSIGSVYETENFSNLKITIVSGGIRSSTYFKVEYPDGSVGHYGYTFGTPLNSPLMYWENSQGLRISYTYTSSNNNLYINTIGYGAKDFNTPINQIQFGYKARQRKEQAYEGGMSIINDKILAQIKVTVNGVGYSNYNLSHDVVLGYERLTSITEKSGDNLKNYNPTVFSYEQTISNSNTLELTRSLDLTRSSHTNYGVPDFSITPYYGFSKSINGDFDGDGELDFLSYDSKVFSIYTKLNSNETTVAAPFYSYKGTLADIFLMNLLQGDSTTGYKVMNKPGWGALVYEDNTYKFNVYSRESDTNPTKLEYSKSFTSISNSLSYIAGSSFSGDFNGDGLTDFIILDKTNYLATKTQFINLDKRIETNFDNNAGEISNSGITKVADVNGDGKTDLIFFKGKTITVYTLDENNIFIKLFNYNQATDMGFEPKPENPIIIGDYNGDGKSDFLLPGASRAIFMSTGLSFVIENVPAGFPTSPNFGAIMPVDYNSDGKTDLLSIRPLRYQESDGATNSGHEIKYNHGITIDYFNKTGTTLDSWSKNTYEKTLDYYFTDTNHADDNNFSFFMVPLFVRPNKSTDDGRPELAIMGNNDYNANYLQGWYHFRPRISFFTFQNHLTKQKVLKEITLGNGVKQTITYAPLKNVDIYQFLNTSAYTAAPSIENYPNYDIANAPGFNVVCQLEITGANSYKRQVYKYHGAVSNLEGLGFLGFKSIMRTNWLSFADSVISTVSVFDIQNRGALKENYTLLDLQFPTYNFAPATYISKTVKEYDSSITANKVFKINTTSSISYDYLTNTSKEDTVLYDVYNNPTTSISKSKTDATVDQIITTNISYETPTTSPYIVGRPIQKNVEIQLNPGQSNQDITSTEEAYTYNSNQLLTQIKKKGYQTNEVVEDNNYDTYGNIIKKTITAAPLAARTASYEYDTSGRFMTRKTDLEGLNTYYTYNNSGFLTTHKNANGLVTKYFYDPWNKNIKTTNYLNKSVTTTYTKSKANSTLITLKGDDSSSSITQYDDLGRQTITGSKNIDDTWSYIKSTYDGSDRKVSVGDPVSDINDQPYLVTTTEYDIYGRVKKIVEPTKKTTTIVYNGLSNEASDGTKTVTTLKNSIGNVLSSTDNGGTINYEYFANGNLKKSDFEGTVIEIEQDGWGRKTKLIDPSAGTYLYEYNEMGELKKEVAPSPKGETSYTIDNFGKIIEKTITSPDNLTNSKTSYTYNASNLLESMAYDDYTNGNNHTNYSYTYDAYKRVTNTLENNSLTARFEHTVAYDDFGRPARESYIATNYANSKGTAKTITNSYKNGLHSQIIDTNGAKLLWQVNTVNARGQLTAAVYGNGLIQKNTYSEYGFPVLFDTTKIVPALKGATNEPQKIVDPVIIITIPDGDPYDPNNQNTKSLFSFGYTFNNLTGNVESRTNSLFNVSENFQYDPLDRLTRFTNAMGQVEDQAYDNKGKITANNLGTYNYTSSAQPYQNTSIAVTPQAEAYYTAKPLQKILYNTFKNPVQITEQGTDIIDFTYNAFNGRDAMYYGGLQQDKLQRNYRKFYSAGGCMEIKYDKTTDATEFLTYIGGDPYSAPVVFKGNGIKQEALYLHRDLLGSILAITNNVGNVVEQRLFDPWGSIVKVQDGNGVDLGQLTIIDRGYTGHEHLPSVGLINMNARLYDPKLHRFLQPDNSIQDPFNTQNYNRYGYVLNNPLKYNDPSGNFWANVLAYLFTAYVQGAQASGNYNPTSWNSELLINAAIGAAFAVASSNATAYVNGNYNAGSSSDIKLVNSYSPQGNHAYAENTFSWDNIGVWVNDLFFAVADEAFGKPPVLSAINPHEAQTQADKMVSYFDPKPAINSATAFFEDPVNYIGRVGDNIHHTISGLWSGNPGATAKGAVFIAPFFILPETAAAESVAGEVVLEEVAEESVILVTNEGVALPKGATIPSEFIENPFRSSNYGIMENGKFIEKLRIDPATPAGMKGPNFSHYHLNGSGKHLTKNWPWWQK